LKYLVYEITEFKNHGDAAEAIADTLSDRDFDEYLDETHGDIIICGVSYAASEVLKIVASKAYFSNMKGWKANMADVFKGKLEQLEPGDSVLFGGKKIECVESEPAD